MNIGNVSLNFDDANRLDDPNDGVMGHEISKFAYGATTYRLERLRKVESAGRGLRPIGLHDHKGFLTVVFDQGSSPDFVDAARSAWKHVGEDRDEVGVYALVEVADA